MSHSKQTKRGSSLYLDKWDSSAKKYIVNCRVCGRTGYNPVILKKSFYDKEFYEKNPNIGSKNRPIYDESTKILNPLELDEKGRCEVCAVLQDGNNDD